MIIPIRNQPITFAPAESDTFACGDQSEYCQLTRIGDRLCFQLRQSSCLPQLLCNSDFSVFSPNAVDPYGDLTTEAEFDEFTSDPATWYWDEYQRRACTFDIGDHAGGTLQFNIDLYYQNPECTYILSFEISGFETPEGEPVDGELTVTLPDGNTQTISENGAYSFPTAAGTEFHFTPGANWAGCIDNITYVCGGACWDFDFPIPERNPISLGGTGLCKSLDYVTTVTEQTGTLFAGGYYQLFVKVDGSTTGSIEFFLGTVSIGTTDENGIFTLSGVSDGTEFSFVMSEFFDGCVSYVKLYQLSKDYTLKLKNATDDSLLLDLTSSLQYGKEITPGTAGDWLQACIDYDEAMLGQLIPSFVNNSVCMYLELESPSDGDVITNGELAISNNVSIEDDWIFTGTLDFEATQGQVILQGGTGYMIQNLSFGGFVQGATYYVAFDLLCLNHGESPPDFDSFTASLGSTSTGSGGVEVWDSDTFPSQSGHYIFKVVAGTDGNYLAFYFDDSNGLEKICLDNISVRTTPCEKELLRSNCIKYMNENEGILGWEGSKLITACNEEGISMGFNWATGFKLHSRLFIDMVTPRYPTKEDETYLQSNGVRKRVYADSSKLIDVKIHDVDELTHDCIRTMLKCDQLYIETSYNLVNRYICLENEYTPDWDPKGRRKLAEASVEVQKFDNTIFNTNCR